MWIKTQSGKIYNAESIVSIEVERRIALAAGESSEITNNAPQWFIVGRIFDSERSGIDFGEYETEEAAQTRMNSFFQVLDHTKNFDFS